MTPTSRCLASIPALLLTTASAFACPPDNRRDAEAYPCAQRDALVVKQDGPGFAISRERHTDMNAAAQRPASVDTIAIGALHRIDRSLLLGQFARAAETNHAAR